ncbi:hypothetical protein Pla52o_33110 [Novipirellula galeiformis]|uniref:Uncharacterized protein n=1 Tax=Novipirellula galeiformis TaxID=2528004 RepID=A0A5C6CE06_9BACT|nr:hypothetical protein Pla52o_33110 [Novipirellula galeiformis]
MHDDGRHWRIHHASIDSLLSTTFSLPPCLYRLLSTAQKHKPSQRSSLPPPLGSLASAITHAINRDTQQAPPRMATSGGRADRKTRWCNRDPMRQAVYSIPSTRPEHTPKAHHRRLPASSSPHRVHRDENDVSRPSGGSSNRHPQTYTLPYRLKLSMLWDSVSATSHLPQPGNLCPPSTLRGLYERDQPTSN